MSKASPDTQSILECLRRTAHETLERKRCLGHYAVVWENGQIRKLQPDESPFSQTLNEDKSGYNPSNQ